MSDVVCFTRSRWGDSSAQDHPLMSRFARTRRVFLVEPPAPGAGPRALLEEQRGPDGLVLCVPHLPSGSAASRAHHALARLLAELRERHVLTAPLLWARDPADLRHARRLGAHLVVWDGRSPHDVPPPAQAEPPPGAGSRPREQPDLVLVSPDAPAARRPDRRVRVMPPAIEVGFLPLPRDEPAIDPPDQAVVPGPRIGLAAPLDPRLDLELLSHVALALPDHFVVALGAPRGIDAGTLPCRPNIRWLGEKTPEERSRYVAGWDVALVPQRDRRGLDPLALEALALGVPVVASAAAGLDLPLDAPLFRVVDDPSVIPAIEHALRTPRAELARAALRARAMVGWDAAFAQLERWLTDVCDPAPGHAPPRTAAELRVRSLSRRRR